MKIVGDKRFRSYFFFGISFQKEDLFGYNLMVEYSYHEITKKNVIEFVRTGEDSPEPLDYFGGDMCLVLHNIDFDYVGNINKKFSFGVGPSIYIANRIFEIDRIPFAISNFSLYDKLASSGLGINGFLMFNTPLFEVQNILLISQIKFRYTHSVWFDKGIRNLDNYYQQFVTTQIMFGIGYLF